MLNLKYLLLIGEEERIGERWKKQMVGGTAIHINYSNITKQYVYFSKETF